MTIETSYKADVSGFVKIIKTCACGRSYTDAAWNELTYVGQQQDAVETIELRTCVCKSTIAIVIATAQGC